MIVRCEVGGHCVLGSFVVEFSLQLVHLLLVGYALEVDSFHVGLVATHQLLPLARFLGEQLREPALLGIVNYDEVLHKERADVRPLSPVLANTHARVSQGLHQNKTK
jgi:hypothetical protein